MERYDRPRQLLAIAIAFIAGLVDAAGFLSANSYFVSFMSGNTTRLAVDLANDWQSAATPALLIAGFVAGVAGGNVLARRAGIWQKPAVLGGVALMLLASWAVTRLSSPAAALALLVLAMGALNNAFQRDGQIAVGLTYMTGALVRLGVALGAVLAGERHSGWGAYLLLWLGLASGALAGAMGFMRIGGDVIGIAAGLVALLAAASVRLVRREG